MKERKDMLEEIKIGIYIAIGSCWDIPAFPACGVIKHLLFISYKFVKGFFGDNFCITPYF